MATTIARSDTATLVAWGGSAGVPVLSETWTALRAAMCAEPLGEQSIQAET